MKKIDINLFLADSSDVGTDLNGKNLSTLGFIESLSELEIVITKISSIANPSEQDINLVYGLSRQNQPNLVVLLINPEDKILGVILPDELSALKITCEKTEISSKDLGSASGATWLPYVKPVVYRCSKNDRHPRYAYLQRGSTKPDKCSVCKSDMLEIKS